jgi:xylulokinase
MGLYAGFDCSTQSLTVVVIDTRTRQIAFKESVAFSEPFLKAADPQVVHASPHMWRKTLELLLERLARGIDRSRLRAISGAAQQHGSVYCGETPEDLTRPTAPIWMDASTSRECREIEDVLGGPHAVARLTGSRCYPRFTGPQIRKFARELPDDYARTRRIHLVSSWMASLLTGVHAPIDHADGSGMNLMDIRGGQWLAAAIDATASGLTSKLPPLVPASTVIGHLSTYWQERFGLPSVDVVAWSGDNPCSLVGVGLFEEGQLAISLGTSDTIFGPLESPRVSSDLTGHVFSSPTGDYMGITVFRNGALARERIRESFGMSWSDFSEALRHTPAGNDGAMMLPWFEPEITPDVPNGGVQRYGLDEAAAPSHVRAIVEAQVMALARHSEWMGVRPRVIHAIGGAAANTEILQVVADVFDAEVRRFESTDAAALGAALRAFQAEEAVPWRDVATDVVRPLGAAIGPIRAHVDAYLRLRPATAAFEARHMPAATERGR